MQWDLGIGGTALLVAMSLAFGLLVQLIAGRAASRWLWLLAAAAFLVGGVLVSEVWFGWATAEELQPNIDGLSFDEVLMFGLVLLVVAGIARLLVSRSNRRRREQASPQSLAR